MANTKAGVTGSKANSQAMPEDVTKILDRMARALQTHEDSFKQVAAVFKAHNDALQNLTDVVLKLGAATEEALGLSPGSLTKR